MIDRGEYTADVTVQGLVSFLDTATDISIRAGFSGLLIIADEFKLLLNQAVTETITLVSSRTSSETKS